MTTLKHLKALGAIVNDKPIKKSISFDLDGQTYQAEVHVKRIGIGEYESLFLKGEDKRSRTSRVISEAVTLGEEGKERISFEDAYSMRPELAGALLNAFNEVNTAKKPSAPESDSSAT